MLDDGISIRTKWFIVIEEDRNPPKVNSQLTFDFIRIIEIVSERKNHITLFLLFKRKKHCRLLSKAKKLCTPFIFVLLCGSFSRRTFVYSFSEQFCFSLHYESRGQLRFTRERKITMLIINSAWVGLVSVRVMLVPRILLS